MTWTYRLVSRADGTVALHEVYYGADGRPESMTTEPIDFVADNADQVRSDLRHALSDAERLPVLDETEIRGHRAHTTDMPRGSMQGPRQGWQEFFDAPGLTDFPDRDQPPLPPAVTLDNLLADMRPAPEHPQREPEPIDDLVARARLWAEVQAAEAPDGGRPEDTLYAKLADEVERLRAELARRDG